MTNLKWDQIATPEFRGANDLFIRSNQQYQDAIKGLADTLKGVQTEVRAQNDAKILDYINQATSAEQLQSPEFRTGYQNLVGSLGNEYDVQGAAKVYDGRTDVLNQRFKDQLAIQNSQDQLGFNKQQSTINDQTIAANEFTAGEGLRKQSLLINTNRILTGQATSEQILKEGGEFDPKAVQDFVQSGGKYNLDQRTGEQQLLNAQATLKNTEANTEGQKLKNQAQESENKLTGAMNNASYNAFLYSNPLANATPEQVKEVQNFGNAIVSASQPRKDGGVPYAEYAHQKAEALGLDPDLVKTIFAKESAYNPNAVSEVGAVGIGQLVPATAQRFGLNPSERNNPYKNMDASLKYIKYLSDKFNGDTQKILIGYHSGEDNVEGVLRNPKGNPKSTADWQRSVRILEALKAGNGGGSVIIPDGMNVASKGSGGTSSQSADQIQKAYENSPQGIITSFSKADNEIKAKSFTAPSKDFGGGTYKNPTEWASKMKEGMSTSAMITNMMDVTRKTNFKFSDKTAEKEFNKDGVKNWNKLNDAQKAGVLERAYSNLVQQHGGVFGDRIWNVEDGDLVNFQKAIQAETKILLSDPEKAYDNSLDANRLNTLSRLVNQHGYSPEQAAQAMKLDTATVQRLLGVQQPKSSDPVQAAAQNSSKQLNWRDPANYTNGKIPAVVGWAR